jgi:hypothetical protein
MMILAAIGGLMTLVCWVIILIHAFQKSVGTGFLALCVPCYILYYMFAEFQHPQKGLIIAGYFIGSALTGFAQVGVAQQMRQLQTGAP